MTEILYKELSYAVVGAAIEVHRTLGAGFLEGVYEEALAQEFKRRNINFERQATLIVRYKEKKVGKYFPDFVIDRKIILEIKSCQALNSAHSAQALNYLAATGLRLAILLNFGASRLKSTRIIR